MSKKTLDRLSGLKRLEEQQKKDQEKLLKTIPNNLKEEETQSNEPVIIQTSNHENIQTSNENDKQPKKNRAAQKDKLEETRRQTYYITELQIKALDLLTAFESKDKSEVVREGLNNIIPEKYMAMARELLSK